MDILGGIGDAISLALKAKQLADRLKNLELKEVVVDLQSRLIDLKEQIVALREENIQLKADAKKLQLPPELIVKDGVYFRADGDGPFCTGCYDAGGKLHRLAEQSGLYRKISKWKCPVCKSTFGQAER